MKRTQIQIPDTIYNKLKKVAAKKEISLAELIRKAAEYLLCLHPEYDKAEADWQPPEPEDLGQFITDDPEWKLIANNDITLY